MEDSGRMHLPTYKITATDELIAFEFVSEGPKGEIQKIVRYSKMDIGNVYILAFGDKDESTVEMNDTVRSGNGDSEKILATIVATIYAFTNVYPEALIYATGSTKSRTRLYQMGICKYYRLGHEHFEIYGEQDGLWENFVTGVNYDAFIIKRKILP